MSSTINVDNYPKTKEFIVALLLLAKDGPVVVMRGETCVGMFESWE